MAKYRPNISRLYPQRQTPRPSVYDLVNQQDIKRRMQGGGSIDASVQAVLDRGTSQGYTLPSASTQSALSTMVTSLKSDGIWTKLDLFYVFATDGDRDFAKINFITPASFECTESNTPTFTTLEGFTGNGSNMSLGTGYVPSADAVNFTLNSGCIAVYSRNIGTTGNMIGAIDGGTTSYTLIGSAGTSVSANVNNGNLSNLADGSPVNGFYSGNRSESNAVQLYRNGASVDTETTVSTAISTNVLGVHFLSSNGTIRFFDGQVSVGLLGASLDATEQSNLFTRIETYMDAIGKGVVS